MTGTLAVGLVGAGPWAAKAYAPMLAAGPETRLAGVWARRPEAAAAVVAAHGGEVFADFDALLARCDAVAFAVPPDVQAPLAVRAARAGRHLLLDKPLALALPDAEALARAVDDAGVVTQLMLTQRFRSHTREFLRQAADAPWLGARLAFLSGAFVRGPHACAWRREHGALHDLGPHAFDLLLAALGPVAELRGSGDPRAVVALSCRHESGAVSTVVLTGTVPIEPSVFSLELFGTAGRLAFDGVAAAAESPWAEVRRAFAAAVAGGRSGEHDVHRGLTLQRLIERARLALG